MVTQAFAQEAETPTEDAVEAQGAEAVHADPTADTHATTEAHGDAHHSDVFPPFDPATFPSQLLWLAISFAALYILMSKIALPKMGSIIEKRQATIEADLAAADHANRTNPRHAAAADYLAMLAAAL